MTNRSHIDLVQTFNESSIDLREPLAAIGAAELSLARAVVERTLALFASGAAVPFIVRDIVAERIAGDADVRASLRDLVS